MRHLISMFIICLWATLASAQSPTPGMTFFSNLEHQTLSQRRTLLSQEEDMQMPIWIKDSNGVFHVIEGAELRTRMEGMVTIAQLMGIEGLAIDQLGFKERLIAQIMSEGLRADLAAGRLMDEYTAVSTLNRSEAMRGFEAMLSFAREEFAHEMAARDGDQNNDTAAVAGGHICQQPQPENARRFFLRVNRDYWRLYAQNGGVYCQLNRETGAPWTNGFYGYVTISGKYLQPTSCPEGQCETDGHIYNPMLHNEGDRNLDGLVYTNTHNESINAALYSFHWWQCYPVPAGQGGESTCAPE